MGEVIKFEKGCRLCKHLVQIDRNSYSCDTRLHMDDSPVVPIRNGKHTRDWDICKGEYYESVMSVTKKTRKGKRVSNDKRD